DQTVNEGASTAVTVAVSDLETDSSQLQLSVQSSDPTLFPADSLDFVGGGASTMLLLAPAAGRHGQALITVRASDGELETARTFQVTVRANLNVIKWESLATHGPDVGEAPL